jgi:hypothetical protein
MFLTGKEMRIILGRRVPGFSSDSYIDAINEAYSSTAEIRSWNCLERNFNLTTKALVNTGGAYFNSGSTSVTACTTGAWSAGASDGFANMYIKKHDEASYYKIANSDSSGITIVSAYPGKTTTADATAGDSYDIFQHIYTVDSTIETVTHLMHDSYLEDWDEKVIEMKDPNIQEQGSPRKWRSAGQDSSGNTLVEIYPRLVDDVYELRGKGQVKIEALTDTTKPLLNSYLIIAVAEIDLLRRKRLIDPASVSDDMLERANNNASEKLQIAAINDMRKTTGSNYTEDRLFFEHGRGHQWLVEHDPWFC